MSLEGGGAVLAAPATVMVGAAAAAAAVAAGAAFAGGYCIVQAGKGMVSIAQSIDKTISAHAMKQASINHQCSKYEEKLIHAARIATDNITTATSIEILNDLKKKRRIAKEPLPTSYEGIPRENEKKSQEKITGLKIFEQNSLEKWQEKNEHLMNRVAIRLSNLENEKWIGLLSVTDIKEKYTNIQKAFLSQEGNLNELYKQLEFLDSEITFRVNRAKEKSKSRLEAITFLEEVGQELESKMANLKNEPELLVATTVAEDLLMRASDLFSQGEFVGAKQWAKTASNYINSLTSSLDTMRRENLEVGIRGLEEFLKEFDFPPEDDTPLALEELIGKAKKCLAKNKLDDCWNALANAQNEVKYISRVVAKRSKKKYQDIAISLSMDVLQTMGYQIGKMKVSRDGTRVYKAIRKDEAAFSITVTPEGFLHYEAKGFGDIECKHEANRFFKKLESRGLMVNVKSELSARKTADLMREVLLRQGYPIVEERSVENGRGIVLTAISKNRPPGEAMIDADGNVELDSELSEKTDDLSHKIERDNKWNAEEEYWNLRRQIVTNRRVTN